MGDTVDERSLKDGYAAEAIVTGEACGKQYLVTVSEKNSVGFLYDISSITEPVLAQVFHLSPASETKNPIVAYKDKSLGEIDAESILFFSEEESPSGKPAVLFAGAFSSTTSFWEFECPTPVESDADAAPADEPASDPAPAPADEPVEVKSSAFVASGSLIAGVMASIALVAL